LKKTEDLQKQIDRLEGQLNKVKHSTHSNLNGIATLSNYIDRYLPIQIQSTINEVLLLLPDLKDMSLVKEFEKKKMKEFHQVVIADNGVANLERRESEINKKVEAVVQGHASGPESLAVPAFADNGAETG
jgi:hypothetical protein